MFGTMTSKNASLDDFNLSDRRLNCICCHCGKPFHAATSAKRKYCSDACARDARRGIKPSPEHVKKRTAALNEKRTIVCKCFVCGKPINRRPSMIERSANHFCSRECYGIHVSKTRNGKNNPLYGKPSIFKGRSHTNKSKKLLRAAMKGRHNSPQTEFTSERMTALWKDPEFRNKTIERTVRAMHITPNRIEQRIINIINESRMPFKFVGDGKVVIYGLCPDFISTDGTKRIIEVFGDIFHDPDKAVYRKINWKCQEFGRSFIFSQHGYDTLIIWENEMRSSTDEELCLKIKRFIKT